VNAIRHAQDPTAVGLLRRFLTSRSAWTRRSTLYTLGAFGARKAAAFARDQIRRMEEEPAEWWAWSESR
jgi:hypothetical protein